MTRREQIYSEIDKRKHHADCPFDYEDGFKRGVKWADKHPKPEMVNKQEFIEKAKSWVKNCFIGPFGEGLADNIADEFVKYMEE